MPDTDPHKRSDASQAEGSSSQPETAASNSTDLSKDPMPTTQHESKYTAGEDKEVARAVTPPNEPQADPLPVKSTALLDDKKAGVVDAESTQEKVKYPKSVFFIISNEFCERFSYYGMRTILVLYLQSILNYNEDDSTVIYHVFAMLCYFFPILGSMLADSWLGKFRTIFYLSIVYALGNIVISIASADDAINAPSRVLSMIGLLLIAFGTGGIKPCVSAFGGDQFILPQQEKQMAQFFSLFYFAINSGSLLSTFLTPVLRDDVSCLGEDSCYPLAFGIPAILMVLSIIVFVAGKRLYVIKKPQGNVVLRVCKTMGHAIGQKCKSKGDKRDHWLDYADDKYSKNEIEDIKAALRVLFLYLPLPFFWALFDQQGSRWTFQAKRMTGDLGGWSLKPDQMQVINPLLILLFIPMFEICVYPLLKKCNLLTRQLPRLGIGGVLAGVAFGTSAIVEWQLESTYAVLPGDGEGQLRIFNGLGCKLEHMTIGDMEHQSIDDLAFWVEKSLSVSRTRDVEIKYSNCEGKLIKDSKLVIHERKAMTYILDEVNNFYYEDDIDKSNEANRAKIRVITSNFDSVNITIGEKEFYVVDQHSQLEELAPKNYDVKVDDVDLKPFSLKVGGVYSLFIRKDSDGYKSKLNEVTQPNSIHMLWLFPQYIIMTAGEVMYSVTGLEFSYSQAPLSMKSLMQAGWLLTVAFGNLIVVIIAEAKIFERQLFEFILFAGLMFVDMIIFALMAMGYKYVETPHEDQDISLEKTKEKSGIDNKNFKSDDE